MNRVWVFAGGEFSAMERDRCLQRLIEQGVPDAVVAVDQGLRHAQFCDLEPTQLIGDFDSVDVQRLDALPDHIARLRFPTDKDASDLELCLELLARQELSMVELFAVSGGRTDHLLYNWLLGMRRDYPFRLVWHDATCRTVLCTPQQPFNESLPDGQLLSLIPLPQAHGVQTRQLAWPLRNASLPMGSTLGLSNRVGAVRETAVNPSVVRDVEIRLEDGRCLVVMPFES